VIRMKFWSDTNFQAFFEALLLEDWGMTAEADADRREVRLTVLPDYLEDLAHELGAEVSYAD